MIITTLHDNKVQSSYDIASVNDTDMNFKVVSDLRSNLTPR